MQEDATKGSIEHTLHGHSRAITDINFSAHHPDLLATCAVDGYVHCWDLRRPKQPALTFCDWFGGATQVKYNRQDEHIIASSHDRWLRIWDDRKGASPLRSIAAHESKIYGVDWNRTRSTGIVTCSLDKSIKFWDYEDESDEPQRIIRTDFPVWRARHTPFGWGLLAMPQDTPGQLHLYERRLGDNTELDFAAPTVAVFQGHGNHKVKEFLWRSRGGITDQGVDNRDFQLVTWGEDNQLRLQHIDPETLEGVGHIKGTQVRKNLNVTRKGAVYKTFRAVENTSSEKKAATITVKRPGSSGLRTSALSAGMKKMALPSSSRNRAIGRASAMKGRDKSSKYDDQNQKQIGWMSGIKFNKQDSTPIRKRTSTRRLSLLNPEFNDDAEWDAPESLHDEIIRIHTQLPKITFEDVNMDKRMVVASMNGPWGVDGSAIHTKITIVFPDQYPETKAPSFTLGKTQLMSDQTHDKLKRDLHQLGHTFVEKKKGCLEAALCYLLGEVDLETSILFPDDAGDADDDLDPLADESSSDEEDEDIPAGASAMMSQELDSSATGESFGPANRNVKMPLPCFCGARFSPNGKLVCFFPPPKEEKVKSLLETLVTNNNARSKGEPSFESFGRLHNNASPQPIKTYSITSESRSDCAGSSDSDASVSSDSDSTRYHVPKLRMSDYFRRSATKRFGRMSPTVLSQKSSAGGTNTGTGTGTGVTGKSRTLKPKNRLVIYDMGDLLPSKRILAAEYAIFGDGPDVCKQNAYVAEKHGFEDLANIWKYAAMLLHNEVPLEVLDQSHRQEPIFVVAKSILNKSRRHSGSDSGIDIAYDSADEENHISGRVKWGVSPLAKELIQDLFTHFERAGDVQMLAMLSCVFNEPVAKEAVTHIDLQMSQPQTPLTMKTPAFSLDYFPTDAAAWSMYQRTPISSTVTTPKTSQTPVGVYGSIGSSNGAWGSDPASAPYSCGETPPHISHRGSVEHLDRQTQSLSTSPDNARSFRRVNSGFASTIAASITRPFTLASSSPPAQPPSRKRPSPVEMMNSLTPSGITWGSTTVLGSVKEQSGTPRSSYSDDDHSRNDWTPTICTGINIVLENQGTFDDEGCMSAPLLDLTHAHLYAAYRRSYADLLFLWGHPLARLEILKFNGLEDYFHDDPQDSKAFGASTASSESHKAQQDGIPPAQIELGNSKKTTKPIPQHFGLDVMGYCLKHELRLQPPKFYTTSGGAVGRCERCEIDQRQLSCTVCREPIVANYIPCLFCGCVTHRDCLQLYHDSGSTICSGGCDCDCGLNASAGLMESWDVMIDAIERMRLLHSTGAGDAESEDFENDDRSDWEKIKSPGRVDHLTVGESAGMGLSKRFEQVRTSDWGLASVKRRASSLRNLDMS